MHRPSRPAAENGKMVISCAVVCAFAVNVCGIQWASIVLVGVVAVVFGLASGGHVSLTCGVPGTVSALGLLTAATCAAAWSAFAALCRGACNFFPVAALTLVLIVGVDATVGMCVGGSTLPVLLVLQAVPACLTATGAVRFVSLTVTTAPLFSYPLSLSSSLASMPRAPMRRLVCCSSRRCCGVVP